MKLHLPICYEQRLCYIVCGIAAWLGTFGFYKLGFGQDPLFRNGTVSNWIKTFASADHAPLSLAGVRWLWKMFIFENSQPHEDWVTRRMYCAVQNGVCPVLGN